jgi:hypothetical protein
MAAHRTQTWDGLAVGAAGEGASPGALAPPAASRLAGVLRRAAALIALLAASAMTLFWAGLAPAG